MVDLHEPKEPFDPLAKERADFVAAALEEAPFGGWTLDSLHRAGESIGIDRDRQRLLFPRGLIDVLIAYSHQCDDEMEARLAGKDLSAMKIRERITYAVRVRLEILQPHKEAAVKASHFLAQPMHIATATRLTYRTMDRIWRAIGDTSTDFNFYTKRATLSAVYASTFLYWQDDDSADAEETWGFLDRRIENVMQFEKVKAQVRGLTKDLPSPLAALARLRYGGVRRR